MSVDFKDAVKDSKCAQCNRIPMGCPEDDDCPAQYLCAGHYYLLKKQQGMMTAYGSFEKLMDLSDDEFVKEVNHFGFSQSN